MELECVPFAGSPVLFVSAQEAKLQWGKLPQLTLSQGLEGFTLHWLNDGLSAKADLPSCYSRFGP